MKMQVQVSGEGSPIILIPGGLTGWQSWIRHAERLALHRKVVRVQLLNVQFGLENRELPPGYSVSMESQALKEALDSLGIPGPMDLVAWSFGAEVTLDFALNHPDRVRTLTLIEPPAFWVLRAKGPLDDPARHVLAGLGKLQGDISEAQLEQFAQMVGLLQPGQSGRNLPQWPVWMQHRLSIRNSPATAEHKDDVSRLRRFEAPVLLVKGTGSATFLHQIIDGLAEFLPNAKVVEMPGGHAPQIVSMDRFLETLEEFQRGTVGVVASADSPPGPHSNRGKSRMKEEG